MICTFSCMHLMQSKGRSKSEVFSLLAKVKAFYLSQQDSIACASFNSLSIHQHTTKKCHSVNVKEIHLLASIEKKCYQNNSLAHWTLAANGTKKQTCEKESSSNFHSGFFYILTIIYILQAVPSFKCLNGFPSID